MPLLRTLTTKLKTAISPSTSPTSSATSSPTSPTSPAVPSFQVVSGRKAGGPLVKRPEQDLRMDSFIMETTSQPQKTEYQTSTPEQEQMQDPVPIVSLKRRRTSRFREELDGEHD